MRKVFDMQMKIGELAIENIEFDPRSRDEIPELLISLQSQPFQGDYFFLLASNRAVET